MEENVATGGFGAACMEVLCGRKIEVELVALPQQAIPHGEVARLREECGLTPRHIAKIAYDRWFDPEQKNER
jgi:deoxyxylulose-5-phosphate synthase